MRHSSAPLLSRAVLWLIEDPLIVSKVLQSATYMWRYCPLISLLLRKSDYHNNCQIQAPLGKNYKPEASTLAEEMVSFSVLLAFAGLTVVSCQVQFPCDHFLRNVSEFVYTVSALSVPIRKFDGRDSHGWSTYLCSSQRVRKWSENPGNSPAAWSVVQRPRV